MLVRFQTPAYAEITMFGDIGVELLKMMGMTGDVPGALSAEDVPAALENLKSAVATLPWEADATEPNPQKEPPVSLRNRAFPLIELLSAAAKQNKHVMWK